MDSSRSSRALSASVEVTRERLGGLARAVLPEDNLDFSEALGVPDTVAARRFPINEGEEGGDGGGGEEEMLISLGRDVVLGASLTSLAPLSSSPEPEEGERSPRLGS